MSFISGSTPTANTSGITVEQSPDDSAVLTIGGGETTSNFNVTAGAYRAKIHNAGIGSAGNAATAVITIGGSSFNLFPGDTKEWTAKRDTRTGELKVLPLIEVVTNGAEIWYETES